MLGISRIFPVIWGVGLIAAFASAQSRFDIDSRQQQIQNEAAKLSADCTRILQEMRSGMWCSECRRSSSEIEGSGEAFQTHLNRVKGKPVPATQQQLDAKSNDCKLKHEQLAREFERLNAQRQQIRRAQEQARLDEDRGRREAEQRSYQQQERQRAERYLQEQRAREERGAQGAQLIQDVIHRNLQNQATVDEMLSKVQGILEGGRGSGESVLRPAPRDYSDDGDSGDDRDAVDDALSRYTLERDAALRAYQERASQSGARRHVCTSSCSSATACRIAREVEERRAADLDRGSAEFGYAGPPTSRDGGSATGNFTREVPANGGDYFSSQLTADLSTPRVSANDRAGNRGTESFFFSQLYTDINGNGGSSDSGPNDREHLTARRVNATIPSGAASASQQDYFQRQLLQETESSGTTGTDGGRDLSASARTTAQQFVQGASEKLADAWLKSGDGSIKTAIQSQARSTFERFLENRLTGEAAQVNALTKFRTVYDELDPVDKADAAFSARTFDVFRNFLRDRDNMFRFGRGTLETADNLINPGFVDVFGESGNPSR